VLIPQDRVIGYLVGYANLTNARSLALLGDPDASAYELPFFFSSPEKKSEFLNLVCSNENMGKDSPLKKLGMLVPSQRSYPMMPSPHVVLIAATLCAGTEDDCAVS